MKIISLCFTIQMVYSDKYVKNGFEREDLIFITLNCIWYLTKVASRKPSTIGAIMGYFNVGLIIFESF